MIHRPTRLSASDLYSLPLVHDVALSPDGSRVAYVVTTMRAESDAYIGSIRIAGVGDNSHQICTSGTARDQRPRWSPDGRRILFISDRTGRRQIWLIDLETGDVSAAPTVEGNVSDAVFSPDGRSIAAIVTGEVESARVSARGWRRVTRVRYRADGFGYLDDLPRLWLIDLEKRETRALTDGSGVVASPAWSPDGKVVAFAGEHRAEADSIWHTELWVCSPEHGDRLKKICALRGALESPAWSPDGARIAFVGHDEGKAYALASLRLYTVAPDGSALACLTPNTDWTCGNFILNDLEASANAIPPWFAPNGDIIVVGTSRGSAGAFAVDVRGGAKRLTPPTHSVTEFSSADGMLAFAASDSATPPEIYVAPRDGGWRQVTSESAAWCDGKLLRKAERIPVAGPAGPIDAWHLRSEGPGSRPCILEIHGGPHAAYGDVFFFEFQLLAAAGYDVIFANPRGSQGYGDAFVRAIVDDWAAPAFADCSAALDAAIAFGSIDEARLGIAGGSYGGYLTLWAVGHTNRFAAAVAMRSAANLASLWGTSEVGRMLDAELGGTPSEAFEPYRKSSPLAYAEQIKTPVLLIHAEHDYRCPIEQSEQMFTPLVRAGAKVEFLRFVEGDHGLSRGGPPPLREARLTAITEWFDRYLGAPGGTQRASN